MVSVVLDVKVDVSSHVNWNANPQFSPRPRQTWVCLRQRGTFKWRDSYNSYVRLIHTAELATCHESNFPAHGEVENGAQAERKGGKEACHRSMSLSPDWGVGVGGLLC